MPGPSFRFHDGTRGAPVGANATIGPVPPERRPADAATGLRPLGLGIAVVFDWALTVQLLTQAVAGQLGLLRLQPESGVLAGRLAGAALTLLLGEALRRGRNWARRGQIALCAAVTVGGAVSAVGLLAGHGGRSAVASTVIMLTVAPWIAVRLAARRTREWFAPRQDLRSRRTGGVWLRLVAGQAAVWGVLVALSQSL